MVILALANGKGGVGKSSLSASLAISLAEHGHKVLLVDADLGLSSLDLLLGVRPGVTLKHVVRDGIGVGDATMIGPEGIAFVPGESGASELVEMDAAAIDAVAAKVVEAGKGYDYVVLDTASGLGAPSMAFLCKAHRVLVVATPDPSSILDAYALTKALFGKNEKADVSLIVNKAEYAEQGRTVFNRYSAIVGQFLGREVGFAGGVSYDESVRRAARARQPFILADPKCAASRQIDGLVERLAAPPEEQADEPDQVSLLQRMRKVFQVFKRGEEPEDKAAEEERQEEAA